MVTRRRQSAELALQPRGTFSFRVIDGPNIPFYKEQSSLLKIRRYDCTHPKKKSRSRQVKIEARGRGVVTYPLDRGAISVHISPTIYTQETPHMQSPVHMEIPVGTVLVYPRRKHGQANLGRGTQAVLLTKSDLEELMHLRLGEASKQLGLSTSTVKKVCRTLGIFMWKKAVSSSAERQSFFDNMRASALPSLSHTSEQASCMVAGSGVASGSGLSIRYTTSTAAEQEPADNAPSTSASSSSTVDGGTGADPSETRNPTP